MQQSMLNIVLIVILIIPFALNTTCLAEDSVSTLESRWTQAEPREDVAGTIMNLKMLGSDVIFRAVNVWGSDLKEAAEVIEESRVLIEAAHKENIKVSAMLGMLAVFPRSYSEEFIDSNATRDPMGRLIRIDESFYHGCLENEGWRDYFKELLSILVDAGIDIIEIDQPALETWRGECYCNHCMKAFRNWLTKKYTSDQITNLLRIKDISLFDYRDYLKATGLAGLSEWDRLHSSRFGHEYWLFQVSNNLKRVQEVAEFAKAAAREKDRELLIFGNVWGLASEYIPVATIFDIVNVAGDLRTPEIWEPSPVRTGPPWVSWIPVFKIARAIAEERMMLSFLDTRGLELAVERFKKLGDLASVIIPEAFFSGVNYAFPYRNRVAHPLERHYPFEPLLEISDYLDKVQPLLKGRTNADIAVMVPFSSLLWQRFSKDYHGTARILMDEHRLFDVIFTGDGQIIPDKFSLSDLKKYKVLIMPDCYSITPSQQKVITEFLDNDGVVIASGGLDLSDSLGYQKAEEKTSLASDKRILHFRGEAFKYAAERNETIRTAYTRLLDTALPEKHIELSGVSNARLDNIRVERWQNSNETVVCLVNANHSRETGVEKLENLELSVSWTDNNATVHLYVPGAKDSTVLESTLSDGSIKMTIPEMNSCAVIQISRKDN